MNCLELVWEGFALSLQQGYNILLSADIPECTLEEYKVYSQFVRYGYRLQRYLGHDVIENYIQKTVENIVGDSELKESKVPVNYIDCKGDKLETNLNLKSVRCRNNEGAISVNCESQSVKNKSAKIEIISEETVVNNIKILKDTTGDNNDAESAVSKWPGTRIKRNVKLLPKRTNYAPMSLTNLSHSKVAVQDSTDERRTAKHSTTLLNFDSPCVKKPRHEVIELSDDEVEEIPTSMSRMDMLNLLPNIASHSLVPQSIQGFIPDSIKPQKNIYLYEKWKLHSLHRGDKFKKLAIKSTQDSLTASPERQHPLSRRSNMNTILPCANQNQRSQFCSGLYYGQQIKVNNCHTNHFAAVLEPSKFSYCRYLQWYGKNAILQQSSILQFQQNCSKPWVQSHQSHRNHYTNILLSVMGNIVKSFFVGNQHQSKFLSNFFSVSSPVPWLNSSTKKAYNSNSRRILPTLNVQNVHKSTFKDKNTYRDKSTPAVGELIGPSTWSELKQQWDKERTITIDVEDLSEVEDCGEVEVVEQKITPLFTIKKTTCLPDIYDKLKIIKSAPGKVQRQNAINFKVSYNVYSNNQHYKKANPGSPICRLLIKRQNEEHCSSFVELHQLPIDRQDVPLVMAYVTKTSISYIRPGIVLVSDLS